MYDWITFGFYLYGIGALIPIIGLVIAVRCWCCSEDLRRKVFFVYVIVVSILFTVANMIYLINGILIDFGDLNIDSRFHSYEKIMVYE